MTAPTAAQRRVLDPQTRKALHRVLDAMMDSMEENDGREVRCRMRNIAGTYALHLSGPRTRAGRAAVAAPATRDLRRP